MSTAAMGARGGSAVRNMVVLGAMMVGLRQVDQSDPTVVTSCRALFAVYMLLSVVLNQLITYRVQSQKDETVIEVPQRASPFAPPSQEQAAAPERKTVLEYDLAHLASLRSQVLINCLLIAFLHFKMGNLTPLVMSSVMGLTRLYDDPLIHVLNRPSEGDLKRPFRPEANPLLNVLRGAMGVSDEGDGANNDGAGQVDNAIDHASVSDESGDEDEESVEEEVEVEYEDVNVPGTKPAEKKSAEEKKTQ